MSLKSWVGGTDGRRAELSVSPRRQRGTRTSVNGPALSSLGSLAFGGGFRVGTELLEEQGGGWKATTPRTRPGCDSELDLQQRAASKVTTNGPPAPAKLIPGPAKRSFVPPPGRGQGSARVRCPRRRRRRPETTLPRISTLGRAPIACASNATTRPSAAVTDAPRPVGALAFFWAAGLGRPNGSGLIIAVLAATAEAAWAVGTLAGHHCLRNYHSCRLHLLRSSRPARARPAVGSGSAALPIELACVEGRKGVSSREDSTRLTSAASRLPACLAADGRVAPSRASHAAAQPSLPLRTMHPTQASRTLRRSAFSSATDSAVATRAADPGPLPYADRLIDEMRCMHSCLVIAKKWLALANCFHLITI